MTVTSAASSGGGLPDFGVFQNQKVYTVYLDMRATDDDTAPSWTLQYAVLQPNARLVQRRIEPGSRSADTAVRKHIPELTPELAQPVRAR